MVAIRLKGHEKFHLREGWIAKGLYGVSKNAKVFTGNEGTDQLGVGTNMVKSIKYWMLAMGLIGEEQRNGAELTEFGKMILKYDAFLEDDLSLWLLHSHIAKMHSGQRCGTCFLINVRQKNLQKKNFLWF